MFGSPETLPADEIIDSGAHGIVHRGMLASGGLGAKRKTLITLKNKCLQRVSPHFLLVNRAAGATLDLL